MILRRFIHTTAFRLTLLYLAIFVTSLATVGALSYWSLKDALSRKINTDIRAEADALRSAYRAGGIEQLKTFANDARRFQAWHFRYSVLSAEGRAVVGIKRGFNGVDTAFSAYQINQIRMSREGIRTLTLALDGQYQLLIASNSRVLQDVEDVLVASSIGIAFIVFLLGLSGGYLLSANFLKRVDDIASTAAVISDGNLSKRIPLQGSDDELDRLSQVLNDMLDRMQGLMERLQQVSNDIAHDLRTPISRLRHRLDEALASDRPREELKSSLLAAVSETDDILETFGALLRISQIESGSRKSAFKQLDLSAVVGSVAEAYRPSIEDEHKTLKTSLPPGAVMVGDAELLTQLISNLIENAIRYTPEGSTLRIVVTNKKTHLVFAVSDNGPGVSPDLHDKLFDRHFRGDQSRNTSGSGLGLSIVKAVADLHSAKISIKDNAPGLIVEVRFVRQKID